MANTPELSLGNGIVEITALTALLGSSTTESLALGSRGACGLPWAALGVFGSLFLAKACISACTPSWLRDTIGVRNQSSDFSVGFSESLNRGKRVRKNAGEAVGVMVKICKGKASAESHNLSCEAFEDVYVFDEYTAGHLRTCTSLEADKPLQTHLYMKDAQWAPLHRSQTRADWISAYITLLKVIEVYVLYHFGSYRIYWITAICWVYFLLATTIIQYFGLGRAYDERSNNKCLDILAGKLPTPGVLGGERRVLFDVPINVRKSRVWRLIWAIGSFVCVCSLTATYVLLAREPPICFNIWLGFQILWLFLRSVFYHFAADMDDITHIITPPVAENRRPTEMNFRLLALATALSRYQVLNHPRGAYSYAEDTQNPSTIRRLLETTDFKLLGYFRLLGDVKSGDTVDVSVAAVIGDTVLSSISWIMGHPLTGMDLYDCCILALQDSGQTVLIPAARVLACRLDGDVKTDIEATVTDIPREKGISNSGANVSWVYWIPSSGEWWLTFSTTWTTATNRTMSVIGKRKMTVTSSSEISDKLKTGKLLVSLESVAEVEDTVRRSTIAAQVVRDMLKNELGQSQSRAKGY